MFAESGAYFLPLWDILNKFKEIRPIIDEIIQAALFFRADDLSCNFALIMSNCRNVCKKGLKLFVKGCGIKFVHPVKQKGECDYEHG